MLALVLVLVLVMVLVLVLVPVVMPSQNGFLVITHRCPLWQMTMGMMTTKGPREAG